MKHSTAKQRDIKAVWECLQSGMLSGEARAELIAIVEEYAPLQDTFSGWLVNNVEIRFNTEQRFSAVLRILARFSSWPGQQAVLAALQQHIEQLIRNQHYESLAGRLFHAIKNGENSQIIEQQLLELTKYPSFQRLTWMIGEQFGFTAEEQKREINLPAIIWEALSAMSEWLGLAAFQKYLCLQLRGHYRDLTRGLRDGRRLSDRAADLLNLLRTEVSTDLTQAGLRQYLVSHLGQIQDLAFSQLGLSFDKTNRAIQELIAKRGTFVVPLEEAMLELPASQASFFQPDWLNAMMLRLENEHVIPPPPVELARLMLETRLQAIEDGHWGKIWEQLCEAHPEQSYRPQQWAKLFNRLSQALKEHLKQRYSWAPDNWHGAFWSWVLGCEGNNW